MSIHKSVCVMSGSFSNPFGDKKQYTTFSSGGCQYFIALDPKQIVTVDLEVRAEFELEHKSIVENGKNGPQVAGMLKPSRLIRISGENSADKK